jgi:hypothetical protein
VEQNPDDLARRLLFILHWGLVEARNLALSAGHHQIADLADTLEILPGLIADWDGEKLDLVRSILKTYDEKYVGRGFVYSDYLGKYAPPDRF